MTAGGEGTANGAENQEAGSERNIGTPQPGRLGCECDGSATAVADFACCKARRKTCVRLLVSILGVGLLFVVTFGGQAPNRAATTTAPLAGADVGVEVIFVTSYSKLRP